MDKKLVLGGTLCENLTILAAKKLFYFQQQVIAEAVCSAASKNIRAWQLALLHKHTDFAMRAASQTFALGSLQTVR